MAFIVVYDACVLYPNTLRDLLIRIAQSGLVQAKWTDRILDERCAGLSRASHGMNVGGDRGSPGKESALRSQR
jgi:hypothetical protein